MRRSADGRKRPVHGVRRAPQRGRPHGGRAAVRLLKEQRFRRSSYRFWVLVSLRLGCNETLESINQSISFFIDDTDKRSDSTPSFSVNAN